MNKITHCLLFIISIFFLGCSNNRPTGFFVNTHKASLRVNTEQTPKVFTYHDSTNDIYSYIDSIELIQIESTDECIIGQVSSIYIVNDTLFVVDCQKAKSIFAFNMNGDFLYKIHKLGNGPGEYQSLNVVHILNGEIHILDWLTWKLIKYDLSGNLLHELKFEVGPVMDFICPYPNVMLLAHGRFSERTPFRIEIVNPMTHEKESAFPFKNNWELKFPNGISNFKFTNSQEILFTIPLCDTIFQYLDHEIIPKYNLNLNDATKFNAFFMENEELNVRDFLEKFAASGNVDIRTFMILDDWICLCYSKNMKGYTAIISKESYQGDSFVSADMKTRKLKDISYLIYGTSQNKLLTAFDETLFDLMSDEELKVLYTKLKSEEEVNMIKSLKSTSDNPVVCFFNIKGQ